MSLGTPCLTRLVQDGVSEQLGHWQVLVERLDHALGKTPGTRRLHARESLLAFAFAWCDEHPQRA